MKTILIALSLGSLTLLAGCDTSRTQTKGIIDKTYDQTSRQTIIPEACQHFFDGCNQCTRNKDNATEASCTRMYCETYTKPHCNDEEVENNTTKEETDAYVGLTTAEAESRAEASNQLFRIVEIDGEPQIVTYDHVPGRLNASITSGIITNITIE